MEKFADLHLHTIYSDGTYTPEKLIADAFKQDLSCVSITDHDTVSGIALTVEEGRKKNIEVLPGIELTTEFEGTEVHILGYLFDYQSELLAKKLEILNKNRIERVYKITDKLKDLGINLDPEAVFNLAKGGSPGRLHIARAMAASGLVGSTYEAFKKYIGDKCPAYVAGFRLSPQEGIGLIRNIGGIAVLAHPYVITRDDLILQFVDFGLMGIEVYYPEHSQSMINFYLQQAKQYGLLVTGGSDCHGEAKPEIKLGSIKIPYDLVEKLKAAKDKL